MLPCSTSPPAPASPSRTVKLVCLSSSGVRIREGQSCSLIHSFSLSVPPTHDAERLCSLLLHPLLPTTVAVRHSLPSQNTSHPAASEKSQVFRGIPAAPPCTRFTTLSPSVSPVQACLWTKSSPTDKLRSANKWVRSRDGLCSSLRLWIVAIESRWRLASDAVDGDLLPTEFWQACSSGCSMPTSRL